MKHKGIGWVAKASGVNTQTVLYYERQGLLPKPPRDTSGYRVFDDKAVERIRFVKRAQKLGFSLKQIGELLIVHEDNNATCGDVKTRVRNHIEDIKKKIDDLDRMQKALEPLLCSCPGKGPLTHCSILGALLEDD